MYILNFVERGRTIELLKLMSIRYSVMSRPATIQIKNISQHYLNFLTVTPLNIEASGLRLNMENGITTEGFPE